MGTTKEIFALVVQADVSGGAAKLRQFSAGVEKDLQKAQSNAAAFAQQATQAGAKIGAAGAAGVAFFVAMGLSARATAGEVLGLQRVAGGSAEEMSKLRFAAQQTGTDLGVLSASLVKLSKAAASDKGAEKLAEYGVAARDAEGNLRPVNDILTDLAGAVKALPNGTEKNDLITSVLGRGGAALIPLLNRGSAGLADLGVKAEEFGAVLSGETLEASKAYTAAQRDMTTAVDGFKTTLGKDVLPTLTAVNERMAALVTSGAKAFESLPEGARKAAVGAGLLGSEVAAVGGGLVTFAGSAYLASQGVGSLAAKFPSLAPGKVAGGFAAATVAVVGFTYALAENQRQFDEGIAQLGLAENQILTAFDPERPQRFTVAVSEAAQILAGLQDVGPQGTVDTVKDFFGIYGAGEELDNRAELTKTTIEGIKKDLAQLTPEQGTRLLDGISEAAAKLGPQGAQVAEQLKPLYDQIADTQSIEAGRNAVDAYGEAVASAAPKVISLTEALNGLADGIDPGELTVYANTLQSSVSPIFALIDANKSLEDAQNKVASASSKSSVEITNAYDRLADAKQALDDVLKGDDDGLDQISPEAQIANARAKVLAANADLLRNPQDADAQTRRDEGLADEDRAIQRRQDLKREATQRERQIRDARKQVADAEKGVSEAQQKQGADLAGAQDQLAKAYFDRLAAEALLAEGIASGAVNIEAIGDQIDEAVKQGILPQSSSDALKERMKALETQAGLAALALGSVAQIPAAYSLGQSLGAAAQAKAASTLGAVGKPQAKPFIGPVLPAQPTRSYTANSSAGGQLAPRPRTGVAGGIIGSGQPRQGDTYKIYEQRSPRQTAAAVARTKRREKHLRGR